MEEKYLHLFVFVGFIALSGCEDTTKRAVIATAPKVFLTSTVEKVCLVFVNIEADGLVEINLYSGSPLEKLLTTVTHRVYRGKSTCVDFPVPNMPISKGLLEVACDFSQEDYMFSKRTEIIVKQHSALTFIQTDKPIYKPGQTVNFRILRLNANLKPVIDMVPEIWIEGPSGIRIAQWLNVTTDDGLIDLKMDLSREPVLGHWAINVGIGSVTETLQFEVKDYVLPKFEVKITSPPFISTNHQSATWTVCAHYSYGKPVKGIADINSATAEKCTQFKTVPTINFNGKIHGCVNITAYIRNPAPEIRCGWKGKIVAKVTEDGTGETIIKDAEIIIHRLPLFMDFASRSPEYFKPGLPFSGKLLVTTPDGAPAPGEPIQMNVSAGEEMYHKIILGTRDAVSDENGLITFTVGSMPNNVNHVHIEAKSTRWLPERHIDQPYESIQMQPWFSPTRSHMQIDQIYEAIPCRTEYHFKVRITDKNIENYSNDVVFYQVISRGNIVSQNSVEPQLESISSLEVVSSQNSLVFMYPYVAPEVHQMFTIVLPILPSMFPVSRLLLFYIRPHLEVVSASLEFDVQTCFENQVKLSFNPEEVMPAESTIIHLEASPHSLCGIGVVDKSVHFLRKDNQITQQKIEKELIKFDIPKGSRPSQRSQRSCIKYPYSEHPFQFSGRMPETRFGFRKRSVVIGPITNYLDTIDAFDNSGLVVISDLTLETRPCWHKVSQDRPVTYLRGAEFSPLAVSLTHQDVIQPSRNKVPHQKKKKFFSKSKVEIRNYFPETWLWELFRVGEAGFVESSHAIPHTITDWVGSAFCTSRLDGVGIASSVTVRAFQPFFLTYTLPYSVKRGETVPIIVSVSNYLQECLPIKLTLEESKSFSILSNSTVAKICLCGSEVKTRRFVIRPKVLGNANVTVHAYTTTKDVCSEAIQMPVAQALSRDAISKPLLIKAEGFPKEETQSSLFCTEASGKTFQQNIDLFLPELPIVPDSKTGFFSVVGDLIGPSLHGLDRLVQLPVGCGEQNMVLFAPNIFVMQYLNTTDQLSPELQTKLLSHMQTGYQRQLRYKHDDGSYSAFGNSDSEGSMWLTAFVIKTYAQAKLFIYIDEDQIHQSMQWILSRQLENGCFPFWGRVVHKTMKGGVDYSDSSYTALTAYVLISLLEAGMPRTSKAVDNAFFCIKAENNPTVYTLVLSTYAAVLAGRDELALDLLTKVSSQAIIKDNLLFWEMPNHKSPALNVEISAYAILCLTTLGKMEHLTQASKIVRWITKQRNSIGGFVSTQDTVVALQALAKFGSLHLGRDVNLEVTIEADELHHTFQVHKQNKLLLQMIPIPKVPTVISLSMSGEGCALVQTILRYNVQKSEGSDAFDLTVSTHATGTSSASCKRHKVTVCTRYKMDDKESNMVVVEAKMISGFEPDRKSLSQVVDDQSVKLKRWDIDDDTLNLYFDKLSSRQKCFSFYINQAIEVRDVKPSVITVYDYYQPELSVEVGYSIQEVCSDELMPSLSDDELFQLESEIIQDVVDLDVPQTLPINPTPVSRTQGGDQRVPVDEVIPPPVFVDLLGKEDQDQDESRPLSQPETLFKHFKDVDQDLDFSDGFEGSDGVFVRPPNDFPGESSVNCPKCLSSPPENFDKLFCQLTFAFTAILKNVHLSKMNLIHDMNKNLAQPVRRSVSIKYVIHDHCFCDFGQPGGRFLVIGTARFAPEHKANNENDFELSGDVYVITLPNKPLEPEFVREARKKCATE